MQYKIKEKKNNQKKKKKNFKKIKIKNSIINKITKIFY